MVKLCLLQGRGTVQICAAGTLFDPEALYCDHEYKVQCQEVTVDKPQVYHGFIRAGARSRLQEQADYNDYGEPEV
jgi:hypothetical protein